MSTTKGRCECSDPGCTHPRIGQEARCQHIGTLHHLKRIDMENASVLFCLPCTEDAMGCGLFAEVSL